MRWCGQTSHVTSTPRARASATSATPPPRRDVDDVQRAARLLGEADRAPDRLGFGDDRPRGRRVAHRVRPSARARAVSSRVTSSFSAWTPTSRPSPRRALHALVERQVVGGGKSSRPPWHMNALKPMTPRAARSSMSSRLPGIEPAPEREVDHRRAAAAGELEVEAARVDGRRAGVERHVDARRDAAAAQRRRAEREALPVRATGFVEVHVRVDAAGEHVQPARVDLLAPPGRRSPRRSRR